MLGFGGVLKAFEDQFEAHGAGYIYRPNPYAAPIAVSKSERDRFVGDFKRRLWYAIATFAGCMLFVVFGLIALAESLAGLDLSETAMNISAFTFLLFVAVAFVLFHRWAANQPTQELQGRQPAGEARTRDDVNRKHFSELSYSAIALGTAGVLGIAYLRIDFERSLFSGMNLFWIFVGGFVATAIVYAVIQKIRYSRK
jgi:hypothetical protein